jgi:hypothetical protein
MEIKEAIVTGKMFKGEIILRYNMDFELLTAIELAGAELTAEQTKWWLVNYPKTVGELNAFANKFADKFKFSALEITFEMFWNKYDDKGHSSKKKTEIKWNRMSKAEQMKAYMFIQKYFQSIPHGVMKKYATTYLEAELWNN